MRASKRWVGVGVVALFGVAMLTVPVYDIVADVTQAKSPVSTVIENAPLLTLSAIVLGGAGWLARSEWQEKYVLTTVGWMGGVSVFAAGLLALVVGIQLFVQGDLKPLVIAADGVLIAATAGLLVGILAAQRKRVQEGQFEALFENVPNPVVAVEFVDDAAIVQRVNAAFVNVFGYDADSIVGEPIEPFIVPDDEEFDPIDPPEEAPSTTQRSIWEWETFRLETADGRREFIRVTVPVTLGPTDRSYGIYIDITDQRQREERLQVLGRTLRHDLRNKLQVITGMASTLETRVDGENSDYAGDIHDAATELLDISERTRRAEDLLADERRHQPLDLVSVVEDAVERVNHHDAAVTTDLPETAHADVVSTFHVAVEELLTNAIEHNDTADPSVEVSVTESVDGEYYDLRIVDDGPGIDPREYEVIKGQREFSQIDHATGVGLWTAYWVLRESGGELSFEANTPRGTVVTMRVPQSDEDIDALLEGHPSGPTPEEDNGYLPPENNT